MRQRRENAWDQVTCFLVSSHWINHWHVGLLARAVRLFCFVFLHFYVVFHASDFAFRDKIHRNIRWVESSKRWASVSSLASGKRWKCQLRDHFYSGNFTLVSLTKSNFSRIIQGLEQCFRLGLDKRLLARISIPFCPLRSGLKRKLLRNYERPLYLSRHGLGLERKALDDISWHKQYNQPW